MKKMRILLMSFAVVVAIGGALASAKKAPFSVTANYGPNSLNCQTSLTQDGCSTTNGTNYITCTIIVGQPGAGQTAKNSNCSATLFRPPM